MWTLAFVTHLPGLSPMPEIIGPVLLALQLLIIIVGTRHTGSVLVGTLSGLFSSLINLLVVGSLVSEKAAPGLDGLRDHALLFAAGSIALGALAGTVGGILGCRLHPSRSRNIATTANAPALMPPAWLSAFALVAAIAILPLLFIGGLVTSTQSGMAVPDWPTSFSANMFLYPLKAMTGGIYYEHAHRLFGALVGLTVLSFTLAVWLADRRGTIRFFATAILLAVCLQGLIGGIRVTQNSVLLAMIHGIVAQLIFAAACALAAMLSPRYVSSDTIGARATVGADAASQGDASSVKSNARLRTLAHVLLGALVIQLAFGAATRHFPPPARGWHSTISHVVFALVVTTLAVIVGAWGKRLRDQAAPGTRVLSRLAPALIHAVGLQLVLGTLALWAVLVYGKTPLAPETTTKPLVVVLTTLHQLNGALLIALAAVVLVWARRVIPAPRK